MSNLIEINNISKFYKSADQTIWALKDISLSVTRGDYIALVGPSGAGKSTLLHIIGGLDEPSEGKVVFKGKDIYTFKDKGLSLWRAAHVGFIFQFYHLIEELTAIENIELAQKVIRKDQPAKNMSELMQYLDIEKRKSSYPSQLSGGERQKVALARALANDPEVLLCDEPTGNLDLDSRTKVVDLLESCNRDRDKTIILVTHNLELAKRAKKIIFLENGVLKN